MKLLSQNPPVLNTLAAEVLTGNSAGLCLPAGTTMQQGYLLRYAESSL